MASSITRYLPGGVQTDIDTGIAPNVPQVGLPPPGSGMPNLPGMPDFSAAINARAQIEAQRQAAADRRAEQLHKLQLRAMQQQLQAQRLEANRSTGGHEGQAGRQLAAMSQPPGEAVYVKPATMMNASGGYMPAGVGEVGAAFAGYRSPGSIPQAAYMREGGPSPAGLGDEEYDPLARNRSRLGPESEVAMGGANVGQPIRRGGR